MTSDPNKTDDEAIEVVRIGRLSRSIRLLLEWSLLAVWLGMGYGWAKTGYTLFLAADLLMSVAMFVLTWGVVNFGEGRAELYSFAQRVSKNDDSGRLRVFVSTTLRLSQVGLLLVNGAIELALSATAIAVVAYANSRYVHTKPST